MAYGWFLGVILTGPILALVVPAWRRYFPEVRGLIFVWLCVSTPWLLLDAWQHAAGFWHYNPDYVGSLKVLNLPLEESLFFYVVPLACLVVWRIVQYHTMRQLSLVGYGVIVLQFLSVIPMIIMGQGILPLRSLIDLICMGMSFAWLCLFLRSFAGSGLVLSWTAIIAGLFFLSNTYLTAVPIVVYNETVMVPWRLGSIPISDIHYNFAFLWPCLMVYLLTTDQKS